MAANLISLAIKALTPELVEKMASTLKLDKALAQKAVGGAVPAILAGIVGKAMKADGAKAILDVLAKQDAGLLGSLAKALGGSGQAAVANAGTNILTSLLGSTTVGTLVAGLAKYAGFGEQPARGLVGVLGSLVMGTLGQQQRADKLDANALKNLLEAQKDHVRSALPADFAKLLSGSSLLDAVPGIAASSSAPLTKPAAPVTTGPKPVTTPAKPMAPAPARKVEMPKAPSPLAHGATPLPTAPWWRLPLIAAVLLGAAYAIFVPNPPPLPPDSTPSATQGIVVDGNDVGSQLSTLVGGLTTTLAGVKDTASAQTALPRLQDAQGQLDKIVALANKLPPELRRSLAASASAALTRLGPAIDTVLALPGVGSVVKPAIDAIRARLDTLAKA